jgi:biopolymer transport protein ExbD
MARRPPPAALVGAGLVVIGLAWYGGWNYWWSTRIWTPLDIPVSLARGPFRTPEFRINVTGTYLFEIEVRPEFGVESGPCEAGVRCPSALAMSWSLSQRRRMVAGAEKFPNGSVLGGFSVGPGLYTLDLDIRQDGSRLNAGAPHLVVIENGQVYAEAENRKHQALLLLLSLGSVGICLIIRAGAGQLQEIGDGRARACALTQLGPQPGAELRPSARGGHFLTMLPRRTGRRILGLSLFGLSTAFVAVFALLGMLVVTAMDTRSSRGLPVRLPKLGVEAPRMPGIQPVLVEVRLSGHSQRPDVYVNSQPVSWNDLDAVLRRQLSTRPPNWPVYLEGDPKMDFMWAGKAIDIIRGTQAEVMLVVGREQPPINRDWLVPRGIPPR